jgi:toxin ParE1/3/4
MAEVIWTEIAKEDLASIHDYISKDSLKYADRFIATIIERVEIVYSNPKQEELFPNLKMRKSENL